MKSVFSRGEKGTGIVEIMVALVVFSIGMLGVSRMIYAVASGNKSSSQVSKALILLQDKVEFFQNQIDIDDTLGFVTTDPNPIDVSGNAGGAFTRNWSVSSVAGAPDMKTVIVQVQWDVIGGGTDSISLTTMVRF